MRKVTVRGITIIDHVSPQDKGGGNPWLAAMAKLVIENERDGANKIRRIIRRAWNDSGNLLTVHLRAKHWTDVQVEAVLFILSIDGEGVNIAEAEFTSGDGKRLSSLCKARAEKPVPAPGTEALQ